MGLFRKKQETVALPPLPDIQQPVTPQNVGVPVSLTPTLRPVRFPGEHEVEVVGESFYRDAILATCGGEERYDGHDVLCVVQLVWEPSNPYDPNAVAVLASGLKIGHLSRQAAAVFQPVAARLKDRGQVLECEARITHGWRRDERDIGDFSVRISLANPQTIP